MGKPKVTVRKPPDVDAFVQGGKSASPKKAKNGKDEKFGIYINPELLKRFKVWCVQNDKSFSEGAALAFEKLLK